MKNLERKVLKELMGGSTQPVAMVIPAEGSLTGAGSDCCGDMGMGSGYNWCFSYSSDQFQNGNSGPKNYVNASYANLPCN